MHYEFINALGNVKEHSSQNLSCVLSYSWVHNKTIAHGDVGIVSL